MAIRRFRGLFSPLIQLRYQNVAAPSHCPGRPLELSNTLIAQPHYGLRSQLKCIFYCCDPSRTS